MEVSPGKPTQTSLAPSQLAHNLLVGDGVSIDPTASIGANVIIHDDVEIGPGVTIGHNVILGRPPRLTADSRALPQTARITRIGAGSVVGDGGKVLRGAQVAENVTLGDNIFVREGASIGAGTMIGEGCGVGAAAEVGRRVRVQSKSVVSPGMLVEDDAFISSFVVAATDNTSGRDPSQSNGRVILRRACRIGANVSMLPGIEIGEEALVGAGAVVCASVPARTKVAGVPARVIGEVADHELLQD